MENRSLSVVACLIGAWLAMPALAGDGTPGPTPEQVADWDARLERAKAVQEDGKARKQAALEAYEAERKACFKKFLVTSCQLDAKKRYNEVLKEARRIENDGSAQERQVKKERLNDKDARRVEDAPRREADLQDREARTEQERTLAEDERLKKEADKAAKQEEGVRRRAANEERLRAKREDHERKVAEKMEKAERRALQRAAESPQ